MMGMVPKKVFLTKGIGVHKEKLASFEMALRDASIAKYNLVRVSSIFPPNCKKIEKEEGLIEISAGQIVFCVLSDISTNEPQRQIASSVGVAIPKDTNNHGYLSEHHAYGESERVAGDYAEDLAAEMLATTLGIDIDHDLEYDAKRELWKMDDKIVKTRNITQYGTGDSKGRWTTAISCAVLLP